MRVLNMLCGILFVAGGVFLIANGGVTFLSVAFIVGMLFVVSGVVECLSYSSYRGENQEKTWVLIDGATTFMLGLLILWNKISADAVVPAVLGLWVLITGIRNLVRAWENLDEKQHHFGEHLFIGLINSLVGIYVFFNADLFNFVAVTVIGACMIVQGINIVNVGTTIRIIKPEFLKTKAEKLNELSQASQDAHDAAKEAIKVALETKAELKTVEAIPEEEFDVTLAKRPITEEEQARIAAEEAKKREEEEKSTVGKLFSAGVVHEEKTYNLADVLVVTTDESMFRERPTEQPKFLSAVEASQVTTSGTMFSAKGDEVPASEAPATREVDMDWSAVQEEKKRSTPGISMDWNMDNKQKAEANNSLDAYTQETVNMFKASEEKKENNEQ